MLVNLSTLKTILNGLWAKISTKFDEFFQMLETKFVTINAQTLTDEEKTQVRENIGVGGCVDWDQNDEASLDYIKNKPFYKRLISDHVFVDVASAGISAQSALILNENPGGAFIIGEVYKVIIDGVESEIVCNSSMRLMLDDSGYYYIYQNDADGYIQAFTNWEYGSSVKVIGPTVELKKLNPEFYEAVTSLNGQTGDISITIDSLSAAKVGSASIYVKGSAAIGYTYASRKAVTNANAYNLGDSIYLYQADKAVKVSYSGNTNPKAYFSQGYVDETDSDCIPNISYVENKINEITYGKIGAIPVPSTATVGQTIVVKSVNENGKPTAWEAVDMQSGPAGADGNDGYTPVRGTDYWTDEDKTEIVDSVVSTLSNKTEIILTSSTEGSAKKFKITVDDSGTLTATEIVEETTTE